MLVKLYDDSTEERTFGTVLEGQFIGQPTYTVDPYIKSVQIDGQFQANPGYNIPVIQSTLLPPLQSSVCDLTVRKAKATELGFNSLATSLQTEIDAANARITIINNL